MFKGHKDIKLAIIFSRIDQSTLTTKEQNFEIHAFSPKNGIGNTNLNNRYNKSSVRQTKISAPHFYESADDKESSEESDDENKIGGFFTNLMAN